MSNLPAVDSVWGVVGDTDGWRQVTMVAGSIAFDRFGREVSGTCYESEWFRWVEETGAVDITAIVSGGLQNAMAADDADRYEAELTKCAAILQKVHPMGAVMGFGLLNVAQALEEVVDGASESTLRELHAAIERGGLDLSCCMDCNAPVVCIPDGLPMCDGCAAKHDGPVENPNAQPHTVEWLCEIGGVVLREDVLEQYIGWEDDVGWLLAFDAVSGTWSFRGEPLGERQPKTRGDVLKWLDVLGIVPATTKGGDK